MYHFISLFIGLRYLKGNSGDKFSRFITYISTTGIIIGVMSLIIVLSVMNGFESQLKDRILGILPHAMISYQADQENLTSKVQTPFANNEPSFINKLFDEPVNIQPIVHFETVIQSNNNLSLGYLLGVDHAWHEQNNILSYILAGNNNTLVAGSYNILLGYSLAQNLNVKIGDKVRLIVTHASYFTPLGQIPQQRNFTVSGIINTGSDLDAQLMITSINDAAKLLRLAPNTISGWSISFSDPFNAPKYADVSLPSGWQWSDWREIRGELFQAIKMEKNMMGLMLGLIIVIAIFNILSALIMVVMDKQVEVAILKTQGMSHWQVMQIFIIQGCSSAIIGAVIGGILGATISLNLNNIFKLLHIPLFLIGGNLQIIVSIPQILLIIFIAVILSLLATLYPAYRGAKQLPTAFLRYK